MILGIKVIGEKWLELGKNANMNTFKTKYVI
jgi:hypothetical protein